MNRYIDLTGQTFNRLEVIKYAGSNKDGKALWLCRCDCGNEKVIVSKNLRLGLTKSCGCLQREITSEVSKDKIVSEETKRKMSGIHIGKHMSEEAKRKNSAAHKGRYIKSKNPNWNSMGGNLVAHHKTPFAYILGFYKTDSLEKALVCQELWGINNGITLCETCHIYHHRENGNKYSEAV